MLNCWVVNNHSRLAPSGDFDHEQPHLCNQPDQWFLSIYEWNLEQIHNKLKISENVKKTIPYSILKVPRNPTRTFGEIQDGVQDDRQFHYLTYYLGFKS